MIKDIINDTLKVNGAFSRTSLTMFVAFAWCVSIATIDYIYKGYRSETWLTMMLVATGIKIANAYSKKIDPEVK